MKKRKEREGEGEGEGEGEKKNKREDVQLKSTVILNDQMLLGYQDMLL